MLIHNRAVAYAAALVLALTLTTGAAQAYQCKTSFVQAEALGAAQFKATRLAKASWTQQAKNQYGLSWSVWTIAASKSQSCNWTGNKYYCIVKAKPCLYVVQ